MKEHSLVQGSPEWTAHRTQYFNASDAPAMMGCSPYETRTALIHRLATGISPEVDSATQRRFDDGHRYEALARPLAEAIIGEDLYPKVGSEGKLSASFDGLTMTDEVNFEHKSLNNDLRAIMVGEFTGADLPMYHRVQMDQQHMVSGAGRTLFMASKWNGDELVEERHCWYEPDTELAAQIAAGWEQLEKDVCAYVPPPSAEPRTVAKVVSTLSLVLDLQVEGKLVASNVEKYKPAAIAYIDGINSELKDDQDFANATADAQYCRDSADKLELAIELALGKMGDVNAALNTVREIAAAFDAKGLALEKLVDARKAEIKQNIVLKAKQAYSDHVAQIEVEISPLKLPLAAPDFGQAAKGKRTVATMQDAVDTALATGKISADAMARQIREKQAWFGQAAKGHTALFADMQSLIQKPMEDFQLLVNTRVKEQVNKEEKLRTDAAAEALAKPAVHPEQQGDELFDKHHPPVDQPASATNVVPMRTGGGGVRVAPNTPPSLKLGVINERLAPIQLTAAGLALLGFEAAGKSGAAVLYHERDFAHICAAVIAHVNQVQTKQAA